MRFLAHRRGVFLQLPILVLSTLYLSACGHRYIKGTFVRDIVAVLEKLRSALEERDGERLLSLISVRYFEDMGTPDPVDDFGYTDLKEKIVPESMRVAKELAVAFTVHDVQIKDGRAHADIRYNARARLDLPAGAKWSTHKDFDRIEMVREDSEWKIIGGL
jgi:hypothetical protein